MSLRCSSSGWSRVTGGLRPGVYSSSPALTFARPGLRLDDLEQAGELLVAGGVPRQGAWMAPAAHVLRVSCEQQVMDVARLCPLPWTHAAAARLYQEMALEPAEVK